MPAAAAAAPRLVSYRVIKHRGYDRVVWQFAGGLPGHQIEYVRQVVSDGSGKPVRLEGHAFLNVTLKDLEWTGRDVPREPTLTPRLHLLRQLKPSGVFEGYSSFGLGLSHKARYRFFTLRRPDRAVLDLLY
jgi:hypothetical protein